MSKKIIAVPSKKDLKKDIENKIEAAIAYLPGAAGKKVKKLVRKAARSLGDELHNKTPASTVKKGKPVPAAVKTKKVTVKKITLQQ